MPINHLDQTNISYVQFHHKEDYSEEVYIVLPASEVNTESIREDVGLTKDNRDAVVSIPFEILRDFVASYVRIKYKAAVTEADSHTILFGPLPITR